MLKHKKYRVVAFAFLLLSLVSAANMVLSNSVSATTIDPGSGTTTTTAPGTLNINASVARLNRMTLLMGTTYFYDSNTTDNNWTFKSIGLTCSAEIKYSPTRSSGGKGGTATSDSWNLTYTNPLQSGSGCGPENSKSLTKPLNWSERQYVVFAGGSSDGQFISVKADNGTVFKKGGTYNGDTVYIQQGVDPYSCPLVIVTNSRSTALIPLQKKDKEADVSSQIKTLFNRELGVGDTACGPTDNDKLGIFSQFGLPESYYNAGTIKDHYETTDFGFGGKNVGSATIYVATIAQAAGIALNGPLQGGGYQSGGSGDTTDVNAAADGTAASSCRVDGIGWIVCPVMKFIGKMNDTAFGALQHFLAIRPDVIGDDTTKSAWAAFRDIANVAFVIAFLIIVYSQITSAGVSNYGIKKMLPRIIVAAILVNVSYYICAVLVDVSNITGSSVYSLFKNFSDGVGVNISNNSWETGITTVLAIGTGIALIVIALFLVLGPAALLAFALVFLILMARQAFVIMLIIISPLAFVAYLLPNTESWFKKWWKALVATLMVYPIIGAVFGASTLASSILSKVAAGQEDSNMLQLIALGVLAVPLFAIPALLKGSLSAAGSIGQKLQGIADRTQSRAASRGKERLKGYGDDAKSRWNMAAANGKLGAAGAFTRRRMKRDFLRSSRAGEAKRAEGVYTTGLVQGDSEEALKLQRAAGGGAAGAPGASVRAAAIATQQAHKQFDEDVAAHKTTMTSLKHEELMKILTDSTASTEKRAAAAGMIMSRDFRGGHLEALEASRQLNSQGDVAMHDIQKQMAHDMRDKPWALGDKASGELLEGKYGSDEGKFSSQTLDDQIKTRVEEKLSPASLAKMNPDEMRRVYELSQKSEADGGLTAAQRANLVKAIEDARSDVQYKGLIKPEAQKMHDKILQDSAAASYGPNI